MKRSGPRPVALAGAVLYGLGTMLTGSAHSLTALYLTYGVIGGAGLGLGYIVPIATLVRWFPDKRGMITGLAVAGFGAGALVTAPAANALVASLGVGRTFEVLGLAYLVVVFGCALAMRNPPENYAPAGYTALAVWQVGFAGLHTPGGARNLAVVRAVAYVVPEHDGWDRDHFASVSHGAGDLGSVSRNCRGHGWAYLDRQWLRTFSVGLVLGCSGPPNRVPDHVPAAVRGISPTLAGSSVCPALVVGVSHFALLRRRIRRHAGIRHRLLWRAADRIDLRPDAHRLGLRRGFWSEPGGGHSPGDRTLSGRDALAGVGDACKRGGAFAPPPTERAPFA